MMAGSYSFQQRLNELAGTSGLAPRAAANAWAGTTGLDVVGALNAKARALGVLGANDPSLDLGGVCNRLAGTTNLAPVAALEQATP
jgi:hypothetical protein